MNYVADVTVAIAGVLLPAFASYKSLQLKTQQNRLIWLRYWVVFAVYSAFKMIGDLILSWLPFYHVAQILLILWISSPKASGAQVLYVYAVVPLLKDREQSIDRFITRHKKNASVLFWNAASELGLRWSSTFCHIIRLYVQASLSASAAPDVLVTEQMPAIAAAQEMDETGSRAIRTDLPADDDMFSDDNEPVASVDGSSRRMTSPSRKGRKRSNKRNTDMFVDPDFNFAGDT